MPIFTKKYITRDYVIENYDKYFVFGDNFERTGYGGQAKAMRGEQNAIGIATKKKAAHNRYSYLKDSDFELFKNELDSKLTIITNHLQEGKVVVWPENGIGTGLAKLEENSPKCWQYLNLEIDKLMGKHNIGDIDESYGVKRSIFTQYPSGEYRINTLYPPSPIVLRYEEGSFFKKLLLLSQANDKKELSIIVPYLPYSREDKKYSNIYVPELLNKFINNFIGNNVKITTFDLHSEVYENLNDKIINIHQASILPLAIKNLVNNYNNDNYFLVGPDKGSKKKIRLVADNLNNKQPILYGFKTREQSTGKIIEIGMKPHGLDITGKVAIIVDDICDGGGTFIPLAKELRSQGVVGVVLAVTHGIFSKGVDHLLSPEVIDQVICTDTYLSDTVRHNSKLSVFPIVENFVL